MLRIVAWAFAQNIHGIDIHFVASEQRLMEFLISLVDRRNKSSEIDVSVSMVEDWPDYIYVSRYNATAFCASPALAEWEHSIIAESFRIYGRTDQTKPDGRRIYARQS